MLDSGFCHQAIVRDPDGNPLILHHRYKPEALWRRQRGASDQRGEGAGRRAAGDVRRRGEGPYRRRATRRHDAVELGHNNRKSGPDGRQPEKQSARRRSEPRLEAGRHGESKLGEEPVLVDELRGDQLAHFSARMPSTLRSTAVCSHSGSCSVLETTYFETSLR
jgi:hypothetical protein